MNFLLTSNKKMITYFHLLISIINDLKNTKRL